MKLKLVKYHPKFAYSVGDVFEVPPVKEAILLDGGYAVPVEEEKPKTTESKPEGEDASDKEASAALDEAKQNSKPFKNKKR